MEQKDFILRNIEKIGALISYLIGQYKSAKNIEEQQETEELINKQLLDNYGADLQFILDLDEHNYESAFSENKGFNFENIELLADLLFTLNNKKDQKYILKALSLYKYIDAKSKIFSLERADKMATIRLLLK